MCSPQITELVARNRFLSGLRALLSSAGLRHSAVIGTAMVLAGAMDYGVNVLAGRWLAPTEYGVFISVTAILQVLLLLSIAIRMVIAVYTAELAVQGAGGHRVARFVQRTWRWAWQWGLAAMAVMAAVSPLIAHALHLRDSLPLWAASLMVLFLFLRETLYGALQGIQAFTGLGLVQIIQALLRLLFAALLIWAGGKAAGAIIAQPLGCIFALLLAVWWLRPYFKSRGETADRAVSWHYSACTLLGLTAFGVLSNLDPLFVKRFFTAETAGDYGPVVTLSKVSLFLPWAIGMVLLPKVTQRQATGRDARPVLLLALAAALAPGLGMTALYFAVPGRLVRAVFTSAYADPGIVLGLASLAATLYAGIYIWLNYALSLERPAFVYALFGVLFFQAVGMFVFGRDSLVRMTLTMVSAGLLGNFAGFLTTWFPAVVTRTIRAEATGL